MHQRNKNNYPIHQRLIGLMITVILQTVFFDTRASEYPDFTKIYALNAESVVTVEVKKKLPKEDAKKQLNPGLPKIEEEGVLKEFVDKYFGLGFSSTRLKSTGSGLVLTADELIITSAHLVEDATKIKVILDNETRKSAKLLVVDENTDLAFLKIKSVDLKAPEFGTSRNIKTGEWVMTIGAPFGFEKSASLGIVSYINRKLSSRDNIREALQKSG